MIGGYHAEINPIAVSAFVFDVDQGSWSTGEFREPAAALGFLCVSETRP
jgi:hypothetical protein